MKNTLNAPQLWVIMSFYKILLLPIPDFISTDPNKPRIRVHGWLIWNRNGADIFTLIGSIKTHHYNSIFFVFMVYNH